MSKLSTFYEPEDNGVFEPSQDGSYSVKRERIPGGHVVGLHGNVVAGLDVCREERHAKVWSANCL